MIVGGQAGGQGGREAGREGVREGYFGSSPVDACCNSVCIYERAVTFSESDSQLYSASLFSQVYLWSQPFHGSDETR